MGIEYRTIVIKPLPLNIGYTWSGTKDIVQRSKSDPRTRDLEAM